MLKFLLLLSIIFVSIICLQKTMLELQKFFNDRFSANCNDTMREILYQNISNFAKINLTSTSIENNQKLIDETDFTVINTSINYWFPNTEMNRVYDMSALLVRPVLQQGVKPKGVILYFHPTIFGVDQLPSKKGPAYLSIGALYASFGYVVVFPDYIGYDNDTAHPYAIYPVQNVQSGIAALSQAYLHINSFYPPTQKYDLYTVGYSEGASYSLWFKHCYQHPTTCNASITKILNSYQAVAHAGLEGAYNLQTVVKPFLYQNVTNATGKNDFRILYLNITNSVKSPLIASTMLGYSRYSVQKTPMSQILQNQFNDMNCTSQYWPQSYCNSSGQHRKIQTVLTQGINSYIVEKSIIASAINKTLNNNTYLQDYPEGTTNSALALIFKDFIDGDNFTMALRSASLVNVTGYSNAYIFTLAKDSVVSPLNFEYLKGNSSNLEWDTLDNYDFQVCHKDYLSPIDHLGAEIPANIFALSFFKKKKAEISTNQSEGKILYL